MKLSQLTLRVGGVTAALALAALIYPHRIFMATKPTVTIEDIEDTVRTEAVQRRQENEQRQSEPGSAAGVGSDATGHETGTTSILRSENTTVEVRQAVVTELTKIEVLYSWLGGKIVIKRVNGQLYLSLFR